MTDVFYGEPDWQSSSGPILTIQVALADLWPEGLASEISGGNKDILADGLHPFLAIGAVANRPVNMVGVVETYNATVGLAQVNIAPGFMAKAYVANVLTYSQGNPNTFDTSFVAGDPVWIDDSNLAEGVTLSRSPLNSAGSANPFAGFIWYDQDEYADFHVGGPNTSAGLPKTLDNSLDYELVTVLLWGTQGAST